MRWKPMCLALASMGALLLAAPASAQRYGASPGSTGVQLGGSRGGSSAGSGFGVTRGRQAVLPLYQQRAAYAYADCVIAAAPRQTVSFLRATPGSTEQRSEARALAVAAPACKTQATRWWAGDTLDMRQVVIARALLRDNGLVTTES